MPFQNDGFAVQDPAGGGGGVSQTYVDNADATLQSQIDDLLADLAGYVPLGTAIPNAADPGAGVKSLHTEGATSNLALNVATGGAFKLNLQGANNFLFNAFGLSFPAVQTDDVTLYQVFRRTNSLCIGVPVAKSLDFEVNGVKALGVNAQIGGVGHFVRVTSAGGNLTSGAIALADLSAVFTGSSSQVTLGDGTIGAVPGLSSYLPIDGSVAMTNRLQFSGTGTSAGNSVANIWRDSGGYLNFNVGSLLGLSFRANGTTYITVNTDTSGLTFDANSLSGTGDIYAINRTSGLLNIKVPTGAALALKIGSNTSMIQFNAQTGGTGHFLRQVSLGGAVTSGALVNTDFSGTPDGTKFLRDDMTWTTVSATDATKLPLAGGTMTGAIVMGTASSLNFGTAIGTDPGAGNGYIYGSSGVLLFNSPTNGYFGFAIQGIAQTYLNHKGISFPVNQTFDATLYNIQRNSDSMAFNVPTGTPFYFYVNGAVKTTISNTNFTLPAALQVDHGAWNILTCASVGSGVRNINTGNDAEDLNINVPTNGVISLSVNGSNVLGVAGSLVNSAADIRLDGTNTGIYKNADTAVLNIGGGTGWAAANSAYAKFHGQSHSTLPGRLEFYTGTSGDVYTYLATTGKTWNLVDAGTLRLQISYNNGIGRTVIDNAYNGQWSLAANGIRVVDIHQNSLAEVRGYNLNYSTKTTTYTTTAADSLIIGNHATVAFTITLHAATGIGQRLIIKNIGAAIVTVDGNASETIDGATTKTLNQWESVTLVDNASGTWVII